MKNRVKQFLEARGLTAYQFIKETGIAPATGYKLAKDESHLPAIRVLEVICDTYRVQPGELVEWVDESHPEPSPKRTKAKTMQQGAIHRTVEPIATVATNKPEFNPGDCCKMPSGARVFIDRRIDDRHYAVTWESTGDDDVVPAHLLTFVCHAK